MPALALLPAALPFQLHLRNLSRALVEAWRQEFAGDPGVTISQGDIFSERTGAVAPMRW